MLLGGIVGLGNVAVHGHLPGWRRRADVRIVAVTDVRPERQDTARAELPGARWYEQIEALLDREALDFVDICTPPSSHAGPIEAALRRDLHVLCEKPLVPSAAALPPLAVLARGRGRTLHTVHNWHHAPIIQRATELIAGGTLGRVERVRWRTLRPQPAAGDGSRGNWRVDPAIAGGGVLTDHGWHAFYVLRRWMGAAPLSVEARLETRRHHRFAVEDTATVALTFPGATAEVLLTWAADERRNRVEILGSAASLSLDGDTLVLSRGSETERRACPPALSDGSHHPDRFDGVAEEFLRAARGEGGDNLHEAGLCVAVEALARDSSRRGGARLPFAPLLAAGRPRAPRAVS